MSENMWLVMVENWYRVFVMIVTDRQYWINAF